jgi:tetratricopeptide (TPR) repeat protein
MMRSAASTLFRKAELAFTSGRAEEARQCLRQLGPVNEPQVLHLTALVEKKLGDFAAARMAFEAALRLAPGDPAIDSNFGNLLEVLGEPEKALAQYDRALAASPGFANAGLAKALLLQRRGQLGEALAELDRLTAGSERDPRLHSARGSVLREQGNLAAAAAAFDRSLALDARRPIALHGRARVALEAGAGDAAERYRHAITSGVSGAEVQLGFAEALEAGGRAAEAIAYLEQLTMLQPGWSEGQALLSRIRWEAGDRDSFANGLEQLVAAAPQDKSGWRALISGYAGADLIDKAAEAADRAARANGHDPEFALLAALYASEAGALDEADRRFAALAGEVPHRELHEASHLLRRGSYDAASAALERERAAHPWSVAAWAMTALAWRLTGDPRSGWLTGQAGLVSTSSLELSDMEIADIAACLRGLHRTQAHPLGQSLRGGTQTRGRLLARHEPEVQRLRAAIIAGVESYWRDLPDEDPAHPLLRHRGKRPMVEGSWSVRLTDGGFHVAHFHTKGVVSSATYLCLPEPSAPMEGWLEIGGAPANLNVPLEPLHRIEPQPGRMALFPSYLFHGTRPFAAGERLTAAFDVVAR